MEARIGFAAQHRTVMLLRGNRQHDHSDQSEKRHGHEKMKGFTLASEPKTRRLALPLTTGVTVSAQASRGDRIGHRRLRMLGAGLWPTPQTPCEVQMVWAARAHTHTDRQTKTLSSPLHGNRPGVGWLCRELPRGLRACGWAPVPHWPSQSKRRHLRLLPAVPARRGGPPLQHQVPGFYLSYHDGI